MCNISIQIYKDITARSYGVDTAYLLYDYWETINSVLYEGKLPPPLITFENMSYGKALAVCYSDYGHIRIKRPSNKIAPEINPKTISTLLHENIHYAKPYLIEDYNFTVITPKGADITSHNCPYWISEINRIHRIIIGEELNANFSKMKRVNGVAMRVNLGDLTRIEVSCYPTKKRDINLIYKYLTERLLSKQNK
jgi:hypothetical protein